MAIGDKISSLRKQQNLTQMQLAEKLNVSDKAISRWETGVSLPDVDMMQRLSKVLGVSISEMYGALNEEGSNVDEQKDSERLWEYYDYNKIWQYKRSTIISCVLFCVATLLAISALLTVILVNTVFLYVSNSTAEIVAITITILCLACAFASVILQVVSALKLKSFSETKYYRTLYEDVLKKHKRIYGIMCAICVVVVVTMFVLTACLL